MLIVASESSQQLTFEFETENLNIYLEFWDGHRNTAGIIHYEYLIKSMILFILVNVYYYFNKT